MTKRNLVNDITISLYNTANEKVKELNEAYDLKIDTSNIRNCYLNAENPFALLKENKMLAEFGVWNGTVFYCTG